MSSDHSFEKIYEDYYPKILQYVKRMVGSQDAEDIAQDIFDKVNRGLKGFQAKSKLSTWIYRIATNTVIDRSRSASFKHAADHTVHEDSVDHEAQSLLPVHKPPVTDQVVIQKEMSDCVNEFIDDLPSDYKSVIVLSDIEGLTNMEIAEILGISIDNVKIRLHRARTKLKAALNEGCDFYHNEQNVLACDRKQTQIMPEPPE